MGVLGFSLERQDNKPGLVPPESVESSKPAFPPIPTVALFRTPRNIYHKRFNPDTSEVRVTSDVVTLADYIKGTSEQEWDTLVRLSTSIKGKVISWVNATKDGGGVALMRASQIYLLNQLGLDAHWYVTLPDDQAFQVTKKIHNTLQGVDQHLFSPAEYNIYKEWTARNAQLLIPSLRSSDLIVIDDPQPSGLIPYIREDNPEAKIIYRNHIQTEARQINIPGTPQNKIWEFLRDSNKVGTADCFVFHPVEEFVPDDVPAEKTVFMPPSTDPLDGLNRPLTEEEYLEEFKRFNQALSENQGQTPLDLNRPYITQIARFDPAKGIPDVLESYRLLREKMKMSGYPIEQTPQLVITGNGATDDPDGVPIMNEAMRIRASEDYRDIADDVKIARFPPHNDKLFNTIMRGSWVVLQLSTREGFEFKVTEASMMGKPVIASRVGGIPLQIVDGETGYLVEPGETGQVAKRLLELISKRETYERLSVNARKRAANENHYFTTVPNVIYWLYLIQQLTSNPDFRGNRRNIMDLVKADSPIIL